MPTMRFREVAAFCLLLACECGLPAGSMNDGAADGPVAMGSTELFASAIRTNDILADGDAVEVMSDAGGFGDVLRLAKSDGAAMVLASRVALGTRLATDGTRLYINSSDGVLSLARTGGPISTVGGLREFVTLDQTTLYESWSDSGSIENPKPVEWKISAVPNSGGTLQLLLSGNNIGIGTHMRADAGELFFQRGNELHVFKTGLGATNSLRVTTLPDRALITALVLDESTVYFGLERAIIKAPRTGGAAEFLAGVERETLGGIAADSTNVYFTDTESDAVRKVAKAGGAVTTLARGQARPVAIAVDASHVYWANTSAGTIMRIAK